MTDQELLETYAGQPAGQWPEDVKERVESNPGLKGQLDEQQTISAMIGLKKYEVPDETRLNACRESVIRELEETQASQSFPANFDVIPNWMRMVAAVVVMLGLSILTHREMLDSTSPETLAMDPMSVETVGSFPESGVADISPPEYLLNRQDPLTSLVRFPAGQNPVFQFSPELNQQIQESFLERSLMNTNAVDQVPVLPVGFQVVPNPPNR